MKQTTQALKATTLQTQILAVNTLHQHCKQIIAAEMAFLFPLIGKSILKVDGSFKAKYEHDKPIYKYKVNEFSFDFWVNTHYYFRAEYGKLSIVVVTSVHGGGYDKNGVNCNSNQQQKTIDLFNISNDGALTELIQEDRGYLDTPFIEADILAAAAKVEEQAKKYEAAMCKVPYLFRDALYIRRLR